MTNTIITPPRAQKTQKTTAPPPIRSASRCRTAQSRPQAVAALQTHIAKTDAIERRQSDAGHRIKECLAVAVAFIAYTAPLIGMWIALRPIIL
ncbi:MAG: hypothetical protein ACK4MQ_01480 [Hyphomonas sp.]